MAVEPSKEHQIRHPMGGNQIQDTANVTMRDDETSIGGGQGGGASGSSVSWHMMKQTQKQAPAWNVDSRDVQQIKHDP